MIRRWTLAPISMVLLATALWMGGKPRTLLAQTVWEEVWSDEFDGTVVDESKWSFQIGDGCPNCGWGNNELQYYRAENATVSDGRLTITAREESFGGYEYTSARMRTYNKGDWLYGRVEIRARLPRGQGLWPAIWMMPTESAYGGWAASGEIDIMELRGRVPNVVQGTIFYGASFPGQVHTWESYTLPAGDFSDDFHVFALEWDPWELRWYVDDALYRTERSWFTESAPYPAPFDRRFHLILNVAVGGNFDGPPDATTRFPQTMEVDYVRVHRAANADPVVSLTEPVEGQAFTAGSTMSMKAGATGPDGILRQVEFYQEDGLLGTVRQAPYELAVGNLATGCYSVRAVGTDDVGRTGSSDTLSVSVGDACPELAPYLMTPATIPGTVEAEYYDIGGEDVAYNDTDAGNAGGGIRASENVDLAPAGLDLGFAVVRTNRTEWLKYTVDVTESGVYDAIVRIGSGSPSASFSLEFDGADKTGRITVPVTGGDTEWINLVVPGIALDAGVQTMRLVLNSSGPGISRFLFQRSSSTGVDSEDPSTALRLHENYPDPAGTVTTVGYELPRETEVRLEIFDTLGRRIAVLDAGRRAAGSHTVNFDIHSLSRGIYVYRLVTGVGRLSRLMVVER